MVIWYIGDLILLIVAVTVVPYLLKNVLSAARSIPPRVQAIVTVGTAANVDLNPIPRLLVTQASVIKTVELLAVYGGILDTILDDA